MLIALKTSTPDFYNDICEVVRLFWPDARFGEELDAAPLLHTHEESDGQWRETWRMNDAEVVHIAPAVHGGLVEKRMLKRAVKTGCYRLMRQLTGTRPPWGSLTGIRPTRLMYEALESGQTREQARQWLEQAFDVTPNRTALLDEILEMQRGLIEIAPREFDLYIGIPFCVTRCAYCSFASGELGDGRLVEPYIDALLRELALCAQITEELGLRLRAGYMGGGTPTALTASQMARVLDEALRLFPGAREWTVEAGRPDTIDRAKLDVLLERGVGRISVNPQTFSDETLRRIGRAHTCDQTREAYQLAREAGFHHINMDLIAALPGEDEADFARSLEETIRLAPESITVHALAIKRSSRLHEQSYTPVGEEMAGRMVNSARARLSEAGYRPYYLYRQKYMAGNLENVGYAFPGMACLYNIDNMEETAPILAVGAGAITKWLFPRERRIERAPNVRNIEQYIARVDEMAQRKRNLILGA